MQAHKRNWIVVIMIETYSKNKDGALELVSMNVKNIREFSAKLTNEEISQIGDTIKIKPNDNSQKVRIKLMLKLVMQLKIRYIQLQMIIKKSR